MTKIAVVYYSSTGNIAAMANAIGEGAQSVGAEVRVRQVAETAPAEAIASNQKWQDHFDAMRNEPVATLEDLEWADGIAEHGEEEWLKIVDEDVQKKVDTGIYDREVRIEGTEWQDVNPAIKVEVSKENHIYVDGRLR